MNLLTQRFGNGMSLMLVENRDRRRQFMQRLHDVPNAVHVSVRAKSFGADLKRGYGYRLRNASGIAAVLLVALFLGYPEYEPTVYLQDSPIAVVLLSDIPATTQRARAPSMPRPQVPISVEGQDVPEDVTIESTELDFDHVAVDWDLTIPGPPGGFGMGEGEEEVLEVADIDYKPHPVRIVTPAYPEEARKRRLKGEVMVRLLVEKDGQVSRAEVVRGPKGLQKSALAAALQFRFRPGKHQGRVRKVWMVIPIEFKLN